MALNIIKRIVPPKESRVYYSKDGKQMYIINTTVPDLPQMKTETVEIIRPYKSRMNIQRSSKRYKK